jgi:hypothetical protein
MQTLEEIRKNPDYVRLPSSKMVKVSLKPVTEPPVL